MSSEALYERYKDALKRGHVASLRGHLDDALLAYAEAASIAPERPTPHASAGTALLRWKRPAEALRHFDVALGLAPRDETALAGRAQALAAIGRRGEAADAYDALAEARVADGRLSDAVNAARLGLELAEGRDRRRTLERLIDRLRAADPDEPGRIALGQALRTLDGLAVHPDGAVSPATPDGPTALDGPPAMAGTVSAPWAHPDGAVEAAGAQPAAPEPAAPPRRPLDRDLPDGVTTAELADLADAAVEIATPGPALERLLDLAAAYRRDGRTDAAIDACYLALSFDPDSVSLHLALVELYDDHGWDGVAGEKLDLVERLARLDGDDEALGRVEAARAGRG
jgi:tetratricopeptide (TPR) repeat protein